MKIRLPNILLVLSLVSLSGCAQNPQPMGKPLPQLTYENLNAYQPYGGGVEIRHSYTQDQHSVLATKDFSTPPDEMLKRYANYRFDRYKRPIKLVFDIQKANLTKKSDEDNLVGFLSGAAEDYYIVDIFITMSPVANNGSLLKPYTISLMRELHLPQRLSLAEREFRQFEFVEKIIHDIDGTVTELVTKRMR